MHDANAVATAYLAVWNEADPSRRKAQMDRHWADGARYVDPLMRGEGRDGIAAMIEGARAQFPGHSFALSGAPDGHQDFVRFSWSLIGAGGHAVAEGTDFVRLDQAGQIADVVGFIDRMPGA